MKKILILFVFVIIAAGLFAEGSVYVLCYHTFLGKEKIDLDSSNEEFKAQLEEMKSKGMNFVTYQDVISGKIEGKNNVLVTIDDGHVTAYNAYKKVLKPMGIKPVFAIYPSIIGVSKSFMTWEQVKELADDGAEIASHTYSHEHMNQKFYDKNPKEFEKQIFKSKEILEEKTGKKISALVYPYGIRSPITIEMAKKAGYKYAFTINWGAVKVPVETNKNVYELPRYMITRKEWKNEFKIIYSGALKDKK